MIAAAAVIYRVYRLYPDQFYWPVELHGAIENEQEAVELARHIVREGAYGAQVVVIENAGTKLTTLATLWARDLT